MPHSNTAGAGSAAIAPHRVPAALLYSRESNVEQVGCYHVPLVKSPFPRGTTPALA